MADKYVIAAGGNWSAAGTWSLTDGGAGGAGAPSASENAFLSNQSGNLVQDTAAAVCLDLDFTKGTGYTGTFSGSAALGIVGSLKCSSGMTLSYFGNVSFGTGAATGLQTITANGKAILSNLTFFGHATLTTFRLLDAQVWTGNVFAFVSGVFEHNNQSVTLNRTSTQTISSTLGAALTFYSLTRSLGASSKVGILALSANIVVANQFTVTGLSATDRILVQSSTVGTPRTITAAAVSLTNVDFMDITGAGAATWSGTSIGDCLGNSGITMTASVTQTATGTASFTWSTHGWTTRVPLPQDDVIIPNAFIAGRTITMDMPRLGRSITSSCTGAPAATFSIAMTLFGSLNVTGISMPGGGVNGFTFGGRSPNTTTLAGNTLGGLTLSAPGGSLTFQDAVTLTNVGGLELLINSGTLNSNGFTVTVPSRVRLASATATLNMGASTFVLTGSLASLVNIPWSAGLGTLNAGTSTIQLTDATANVKTFAGGGNTYYNVWFNNAGSGTFDITGANTFNQFKVAAGRSVRFTAATNNTAADWQFGSGCTIGSTTAASHTLTKSGGGQVVAESATISRSTASPANTFVALSSTDGGNNSGWIFGTLGAARGDAAGSCIVDGRTSGPMAEGFPFVVPSRDFGFRVPTRRFHFEVRS